MRRIPLSGYARFTKGRAPESARRAEKVDSVLSDASLCNMDTPSHPNLGAERGANYDTWFVREVDKGLAAADSGKLVEHSYVRELIDERYPG